MTGDAVETVVGGLCLIAAVVVYLAAWWRAIGRRRRG